MNIGQKILEGLEDFLVKLRTGQSIRVTEVRREETPDGPMHLFKEKEIAADGEEDHISGH
jgi:hypothetical protein